MLALPLLAVYMPSNIQVVEATLDQIVNFKLISDEKVNEIFIEPIFGEQEQASVETTDEQEV